METGIPSNAEDMWRLMKIQDQVKLETTKNIASFKDLDRNLIGEKGKNIENIVNRHEETINQNQSKNENQIKQALAKLT